MDTNDLYYSESSHLIDNENSSWIENTVLVGNENITWQEDGPEITVDYSEVAIDRSLTENEGYLTADTGDSDETSQYFSILESNCDDSEILNNNSNFSNPNINTDCIVSVEVVKEETIIPDITKSEIVDDDEFNANKNADNQLVLYKMDGSDDLFAVQIADDGKGNFQKYQYKVTQSPNGQFEAIPDSMEMQNTVLNEIPSSEETTHQTDFSSHFIKEEPGSVENDENVSSNETTGNHFESSESENNFFMANEKGLKNINPEYILQHSYNQNEAYEKDSIEQVLDESGPRKQNKNVDTTSFVNVTNIFPPGDNSESEYEIEALDEDFQDDDDAFNEFHYEEQTNNCDTSQILDKSDSMNLKISHVESVKDLKQHVPSNRNVTIFKDEKHLSVLVVKGNEKENLSFIRSSNNFNQSNLRSILKSNCTITKENHMQNTQCTNHQPTTLPEISENSEDIQINTTAIKSMRQPRKQTITPVERLGSEIIVQPLVYSLDVNTTSGLVTSAAVKRKRVLEEILQISDESDPEFTLKTFKKKKSKRGKYPRKNQRKAVEITIIETDDEISSEESVIEVLTDHESSTSDETTLCQNITDKDENKNSRESNREIEVTTISDNDCSNEINIVQISSESKKNNSNKKMDTITSEKLEKEKRNETNILRKNKCPMCPKTFPRQITLRKHLIIHSTRRNLRSRNSLRNKISETPKVNLNIKVDIKVKPQRANLVKKEFYCTKCKFNFMSESQYKRHQTVHTMKRSSNGVTQIPLKKQIVATENSTKQTFSSPKHLRSSTKIRNEALVSRKSTKTINTKTIKETLKCEYCGQMFSERALFTFHRNSHKTFPCPNCKTTFTAKLLLDDHLRKNCLKNPVKKRLTRRSLIKCDVCLLAFSTPQQLQNHTSLAHNTKNKHLKPEPNKSNKHLIIKKRGAHDGVPMSVKMKKAFDKVKLKT